MGSQQPVPQRCKAPHILHPARSMSYASHTSDGSCLHMFGGTTKKHLLTLFHSKWGPSFAHASAGVATPARTLLDPIVVAVQEVVTDRVMVPAGPACTEGYPFLLCFCRGTKSANGMVLFIAAHAAEPRNQGELVNMMMMMYKAQSSETDHSSNCIHN